MIKRTHRGYLPWIYRKVKKQLPAIAFLTGLNMAISYANIQFALTTKTVVNSAVSGDLQLLRGAALLLVGLCVFCMLGNTVSQFLYVNTHEHMERDFKYSILDTILHSDYSRISRHHSGDLIQRLDSDAASVIDGVLDYTSGLASILMGMVASVVALLQLAPMFTILCGAGMVLLGATSLLLRNVLKRLSRESSAANGRVRGFLHESISRLMLIQALDLSGEMQKLTAQVLDERWVVRQKWRNLSIVSKFGSNMVGYLSYLVTMLWCAAALLRGRITYGDVTAITSLVATVRSSATSLPHMIPRFMVITAASSAIIPLATATAIPPTATAASTAQQASGPCSGITWASGHCFFTTTARCLHFPRISAALRRFRALT